MWYFEWAVSFFRKTSLAGLALLGACATRPPVITKLVGGRQIATRSVDPSAYEHASRAFLYEDQERWQDAADELRQALVFDGQSPELHARLAEALLRLDKLDDAADEAKQSLKLGASASGHMAFARVCRARGDLPCALSALRKAYAEVDFRADDDDAESVSLELADAELVTLDLPAARGTLESLCEAVPGSASGRMRLAAIAWALDEMSQAEDHLRAALAEEPNQIEALAALAWIFAATGRNDDARRVFRDALDRSEGSLDIAAAFARFLVGIGKAKEAEQLADDLTVPDSGLDEESLAAHVELERSARRFERALALLARGAEAGIVESPKNPISLLRAGILQAQGKSQEALGVLRGVDKRSPLFFEARLRAAEILRESGKTDEALRTIDEAAGNAQGDRSAIEVEAAVAAALVEEKGGNAAAGVARLEKLLARYPDEGRAVLTLAAIQERRGLWQQALEVAERFLGKHPGSVAALNFWGFIAADHNHALDVALRRLQVAVALDPGSGGMLDSLGWVHFRRQDLGKAGEFLEQAARLEPADPEIQWHLGTLYAQRKETERATSAFRRALGFHPDARLRRKLEESLARLGKPS
jgi:tetratricopeptide (TPR) repeat protein